MSLDRRRRPRRDTFITSKRPPSAFPANNPMWPIRNIQTSSRAGSVPGLKTPRVWQKRRIPLYPEPSRTGGKACLSIRKHDHFTPTMQIRRHVRALARNHPAGWKLQGHVSPATTSYLTYTIGLNNPLHLSGTSFSGSVPKALPRREFIDSQKRPLHANEGNQTTRKGTSP